MSLWIKICGLKSEDAIAAAAEHGADAIGFVFAPSPRQVTPAEAARLTTRVAAKMERVAVVLHPDQKLIDDIWSTFRPDLLQIDQADIAELDIPSGLTLLPVLRRAPTDVEAVPPRILFEGSRSGVGALANWDAAAALASRTQLILAGGLNAANVAAAIAGVRPAGVDVSSGVESAPGVKDPRLIAHFIQAARAACADKGLASHAN